MKILMVSNDGPGVVRFLGGFRQGKKFVRALMLVDYGGFINVENG